jgi:hypothetical protein
MGFRSKEYPFGIETLVIFFLELQQLSMHGD